MKAFQQWSAFFVVKNIVFSVQKCYTIAMIKKLLW